MSTVLALETATDQLGVAIVAEGRVLASYEVLAERPHAVELPGAVTRVLKAAGLTMPQLDGVAIDIGPGSFTGLRIGVAFAKALLFHTPKPVIGISSLDVLAGGVALAPRTLCPILDAKQRKIYAARYRTVDGVAHKQSDYYLGPLDQWLATLGDAGPVLLLGDGAALYREPLIQQLGDRALFAPPECSLPSAATLGRLGLKRLQEGACDDARTLVPMYLHPMDCAIRPSTRPPSAPRKPRQATA